MPTEPPRVAIAIPHHTGEVHIAVVRTLVQLDVRGMAVTYLDHGLTSVAINRNLLVQRFLDDPDRLTHLFFLDSDVGVPRDGLHKLVAAGKPVVAGIYVDKRQMRLVLRKRVSRYQHQLMDRELCIPAGQPGAPHWIIRPELRNQVVPCDAAGAGCLLVAREVFERIHYPWFFEDFDPAATRHDATSVVSEDLTFFRLAAEAGFPAFVHTGVLCDHWAGLSKHPPFWDVPRV